MALHTYHPILTTPPYCLHLQAGSEHVRQVLQEHLGFDEIAALPYATYEYEGQKLFAELPQRDPQQYSRLSIHRRNVPSNLYV